jgi:pyruvate/2-oxoglutarate dehydrogenase complex dihydrolipoamide acyltransferase (E2) component
VSEVEVGTMGKPKGKNKAAKKARRLAKQRNEQEDAAEGVGCNGEATSASDQGASSKYSVDQILAKAEELIQTELNFDMGSQFCQRALEMEPDNPKALELTAAVLLEVTRNLLILFTCVFMWFNN